MNVWFVSPAWRRFAVTRLALAERRWLCDELAARGHTAHSVVVADDDNLDIAREYGFDTVELGNGDLGERFNAGYRYAAENGADIFVHIGSDDWVHPDVFNILDTVDITRPGEPEFGATPVVRRRGPQVVAQRRATVVDVATGRLQRCFVRGARGCIPWLIPRAVMEPCGFSPVRPGLMRGIDGALARGLTTRPGWLYQPKERDDWLVDFKTPTNISPYGMLADTLGQGVEGTVDDLAASYPGWLVELAKATTFDDVRPPQQWLEVMI